MYKYTLNDNEDIIKIFDNLYIKQRSNEKTTSAILTNQRLLFLDYIVQNEGLEVLRIARGSQAIQYKEVYYQIILNDIKMINKKELYEIVLNNNSIIEFNNKKLYDLILKLKEDITLLFLFVDNY